jgi:hypothetical protein
MYCIEGFREEEIMPRRSTQMRTFLEWHRDTLQRGALLADARLEKLLQEISDEFPPSDSHHNAAIALLHLYFPRALQLILLGTNALAYIEIYAVLEMILTIYLPRKLAKNDAARGLISKQMGNKNLPELAEAALELGLWTKQDISFIKHLARIRNALAHRNYGLLHKTLEAPPLEALSAHEKLDEKIEQKDASADLVRALRLIIKFTRHKRTAASADQAAKTCPN